MTRLERLKALITKYEVSWDDDPEIEENLDDYVNGTKEIGRFAAITCGAETGNYFIYPSFQTSKDAQERAEEYVVDDLYAERPVAVVDLDTGAGFVPHRTVFVWSRNDNAGAG